MYNSKRNDYLIKIESQGEKVDSAWVALTDKDQRGSSFICLALAIFSNLSGQSVICIYSTAIFEIMTSKGAVSKYIVKQENAFIGYAAVAGAFFSYFTVSYFSRRTLFVGGHFLLCVLLFMTGSYVENKHHDHALACILVYIIVF